MKPNLPRQIAFAAFLALTLSGCASLEGRLRDAAGTSGRIGAGVQRQAEPAACAGPVAHAPLVAGASAISVLKRERAQLDAANSLLADCHARRVMESQLLGGGVSAPPLSGKPLAGSPQ